MLEMKNRNVAFNKSKNSHELDCPLRYMGCGQQAFLNLARAERKEQAVHGVQTKKDGMAQCEHERPYSHFLSSQLCLPTNARIIFIGESEVQSIRAQR
jgi:hypothetical protein